MKNFKIEQDNCPYFCCSTVKKLKDEVDNPEDLVVDLGNKIHPLFQLDAFLLGSDLTNSNKYATLIEQSLRLASRFLCTANVSRHVLTVAEGDVYYRARNSGSDRGKKANLTDGRKNHLLVHPKPCHKKLSQDEVRNHAKRILSDLTDMVDIHLAEDIDNLGENINGKTKPLPGPLPELLFQKFPNGCRSRIVLNKAVLKQIKYLLLRGKSNTTECRFLQFFLAKTLVHELAHALVNAIYGDRTTDPFMNGSKCAEAGFDLEAAIFGGILSLNEWEQPTCPHWDGEKTLQGLFLQEWPSNHKMCSYLRSGSMCGTASRPGRFTKVTRVPFCLMTGFFREEFWRQTEPAKYIASVDLPLWQIAWDKKDYEEMVCLAWGVRNGEKVGRGEYRRMLNTLPPTERFVDLYEEDCALGLLWVLWGFVRCPSYEEFDFPLLLVLAALFGFLIILLWQR